MNGIPMGGGEGLPFGPGRTPFEAIGGESSVRALVDAFYDQMDDQGDAAEIRAMHPPALEQSRDKLAWFLNGWLGGPQDYVDRFGHPRLRQRHAPFQINGAARDAWMMCMRKAMDDRGIEGDLRAFLDARFDHLATFMINRPDG
jgi:hemoglobin